MSGSESATFKTVVNLNIKKTCQANQKYHNVNYFLNSSTQFIAVFLTEVMCLISALQQQITVQQ